MRDDNDDSKNKPNKVGFEFIDILITIILILFSYLFIRDLYEHGLNQKGPGYIWVPFVWLMLIPGIYHKRKKIEDAGFGWIFSILKYFGILILIICFALLLSMCTDSTRGLPDNIRM